ncbi:MAG: hypothetical protein AB8F94_02640 [Saprospiraceae bacterium]
MILLYCFVNLNAQKEPNIKLKVEAGLNWKLAEKDIINHWDWSLHFSLEPKLKTSKKTFIGLRIQASENEPFNEKYKPTQFFIDNNINISFLEATPTTLISFVPTFDYYFSKNRFKPYLGVGIGYYFLTTSKDVLVFGASFDDELETSADNPVGFLIRGGLEMGKLSFGLEFNYLLEADIKIPSGLIIGTVDDSFIAVSIGYSIGNSKRLK